MTDTMAEREEDVRQAPQHKAWKREGFQARASTPSHSPHPSTAACLSPRQTGQPRQPLSARWDEMRIILPAQSMFTLLSLSWGKSEKLSEGESVVASARNGHLAIGLFMATTNRGDGWEDEKTSRKEGQKWTETCHCPSGHGQAMMTNAP